MAMVVLDAATREKLLTTGEEVVAVTDEAGTVIGRFVVGANALLPKFDGLDISDEELDRRLRESRRHPAEAVMERLRSLGYAG